MQKKMIDSLKENIRSLERAKSELFSRAEIDKNRFEAVRVLLPGLGFTVANISNFSGSIVTGNGRVGRRGRRRNFVSSKTVSQGLKKRWRDRQQ
jgi:hypothetical protein